MPWQFARVGWGGGRPLTVNCFSSGGCVLLLIGLIAGGGRGPRRLRRLGMGLTLRRVVPTGSQGG